ncbi:MAG TPA: hypothetical protein VK990_06830 [Acidimicrobiia bacterium]|nr:hypothetical protein [Acidimicrobiia bacterium]
MPTLSVTPIGLLVGVAGGLAGGRPGSTIGRAVIGAWVGFALGAVAGLAVDVAVQTGSGVAIAGHVFALAGAIVALRVGRPVARRVGADQEA